MSHIPDTHAEAWAMLPWLANGRLEAADREWVDAHVAGCAECRAELATQGRIATEMARAGAAPASANDEQKSFDKLWARIDAVESSPVERITGSKVAHRPASRMVRWLAAAVVVQAIGLGVLGFSTLRGPSSAGDYVTVAEAQPRLNAPAVRVVFAPQASIENINTLLTHQGLTLVAGPGIQGNFTAVLSADAVASGASADSVARVISKDPNVSFAQPVAR